MEVDGVGASVRAREMHAARVLVRVGMHSVLGTECKDIGAAAGDREGIAAAAQEAQRALGQAGDAEPALAAGEDTAAFGSALPPFIASAGRR